MMPYLLHSATLLAFFFVFYRFLLHRETFFQLNRWLLLACIGISFLLPLLTIPAEWSIREWVLPTAVVEALPAAPVSSLPQVTTPSSNTAIAAAPAPVVPPTPPARTWSWPLVLTWIYAIGVLLFSLHFCIQFGVLLYRMYSRPRVDLGEFKIVEMDENHAPYSFWKSIFLNPAQYDLETYDQILKHEQIHIQQRHSIDILLAELLVIVQWFNPFAWFYRRAVEHNLEYLTDGTMLTLGTNPESYQLNLLKVSVPDMPQGLTSNYNQSFLEKRIIMMNTKKSSARSSWKYLSILPLIAFSLVCLNAVEFSDQNPNVQVETQLNIQEDLQEHLQIETEENMEVDAEDMVLQNDIELKLQEKIKLKQHIKPNIKVSERHTQQLQKVLERSRELKTVKAWSATIEGDQVCITFIENDYNQNHHSSSTNCFASSEFSALPIGEISTFTATREAGTLSLKGMFDKGIGSGTFTFSPDESYISYLKSQGLQDFREPFIFHCFTTNLNKKYLDYFASQGYRINDENMHRLAYHNITEAGLKKRVSELAQAGFSGLSFEKIFKAKIHGVDGTYIGAIKSRGYTGFDIDELIKAKIHGVNGSFIDEMKSQNFGDLSLEDLSKLAVHRIDGNYIDYLKKIGFQNLSAQEVTKCKIHRIDENLMADMKEMGYPTNDLDQLLKFGVHNVRPAQVNKIKALGYPNLSMDQALAAKIHNISPQYIQSFHELGFKDIPFDKIKRLKIHGITADFIRNKKEAELEIDDYIRLKIREGR